MWGLLEEEAGQEASSQKPSHHQAHRRVLKVSWGWGGQGRGGEEREREEGRGREGGEDGVSAQGS